MFASNSSSCNNNFLQEPSLQFCTCLYCCEEVPLLPCMIFSCLRTPRRKMYSSGRPQILKRAGWSGPADDSISRLLPSVQPCLALISHHLRKYVFARLFTEHGCALYLHIVHVSGGLYLSITCSSASCNNETLPGHVLHPRQLHVAFPSVQVIGTVFLDRQLMEFLNDMARAGQNLLNNQNDKGLSPMWGFPNIRGTILWVLTIRIIVYWDLHWGPLMLGNYHKP